MKASGVVKNSDLFNGKLKKESIVVVPRNITLHNIFCKEIGCKE